MGSIEIKSQTNRIEFDISIAPQVKGVAIDTNLEAKTYRVLLDSIEICKLCTATHYQERVEQGYNWGSTITSRLSLDYQSYTPIQFVKERLHDLMRGNPLKTGFESKAVLNLIQGATNVGSTLHPGQTASSPNGSQAIANDQRVFFSNEARLQQNNVQFVTTVLDDDGNPKASAAINTNAPGGTIFSPVATDHHVYDLDGNLQDELGSLSGLGDARSLTYFAGQNSQIQPGQTVIIQPSVRYPGGSGFSLPFNNVAAVYLNGTKLSSSNVRNGRDNDLDAYSAPAGGEDFIVVWGSERASVHCIYKKVEVSANQKGNLVVPSTELGTFAFVEGIAGRHDSAVVKGTPGTTYNALVYYPP